MSSITISTNQIEPNNIDNEEKKDIVSTSCPIDKYQYLFQLSKSNKIMKTGRAASYNEERIQASSSSSSSSNSRFKHLCTRFKRRFSINKDYRTRSQDLNRGLSVCFSNYKSFSSTNDDTINEYEWPDFEKVYDSIPHCLVRGLPGLDEFSIADDDDDDDDDDGNSNANDTENFVTDETNERFELFKYCKRGKHFRRNALCHKLDKTQYHGQLDTFIQQLMIEKLMRTWT